MREIRPQPSPRVDTRVIYDRETGEILHVHQAVALPGVKIPDEDELRASAVDVASRTTGRPAEQMDVISVREEELTTGTKYKVNVRDKCLVAGLSDTAAEI